MMEQAWELLVQELQRALTAPGYSPALGETETAKRAEGLLHTLLTQARRVGETEAALKKNNLFLSSIIDNIPIMLFVKDEAELRLQLWNKTSEELLGIPRSATLGMTDFDLFPREQAEYFQANDREVLAGKKLVDVEEPITSPKGDRWLRTKKIPLCDEAGQTRFLLGISEDITEQKNARAALLQAKEAAETTSRIQSEFFANVSHELRTPLTLISGPVEAMLSADGSPALQREHLQIVRRNVARLSSLVDDLLDFSKLEARQLEPSWVPLRAAELISQLVQDALPTAQQRGVTLGFSVNETRSTYLDQRMLEKIALNLVSNALKFTPAGGSVEVSLHFSHDALELSVQDSGIGIPPEKLPLLFQRFQQLDSSSTRKYGGTGLGLALVKEFAEKMGGSVGAESKEQQGTRVWVKLPLREAAHDGPHAALQLQAERELLMLTPGQPHKAFPYDPNRPLLLIAEDNGDMRSYLGELLGGEYNIFYAFNGKEALEKARRQPPDIVLADVMMPLLDGVSLARKMKEDLVLRPVPVLLLTARVGEGAIASGLDSGADDYITKPFSPTELRARLRAALRVHRMSRELALTHEELTEARSLLVQVESFSMAGQLAEFVKQTLNAPLALLQQNLRQVDQLLASTSRSVSQLDLLGEGLQLLNQLPAPGESLWAISERIDFWLKEAPQAPRRVRWFNQAPVSSTTLHPAALRVAFLSVLACLQSAPGASPAEEITVRLDDNTQPTLLVSAPWFALTAAEAKALSAASLQLQDTAKLSLSLASQLMQHFGFLFLVDPESKTFRFLL